jgi:putative membrane protein
MHAIIRLILCFALALLLLHLLITGEISLYVNPRLKWLSGVSFLILITLGVIQLQNIRGQELHRIKSWGYLALFLPIAMYLFVPPGALDASMAAKKGLYNPAMAKPSGNRLASSGATPAGGSVPAPTSGPATQDAQIIDSEDPYKKMIPRFKNMPVIVPTEKTYGDILNTLHLYPKEFVGKQIRVIGFVYRDSTLKKHQFVVGRYSVSCCVADASVVGFLTQYEKDRHLKNGQWVEVSGTLDVTRLDEDTFPVIHLRKYKTVAAPKDPYIYFTY